MRAGREGTNGDEMVRWHHWLSGYEFEQTLGDSEGQGILEFYSPWGHRVQHSWATEQQHSWFMYFLWYTAHIFVFVVWNIFHFSFKILCIKKWCIRYCLDELFSLVFLSFSMCLVEEIVIYPNNTGRLLRNIGIWWLNN